MAKRALRHPDLPPGHRLAFFLFVQDQVLRRGDPSVASIARDVGVSHQTIYKALTGPRLPSRTVTQDLATYLGRPHPQQLVDQVIELWTLAVAEERRPEMTYTTKSRGRPWSPINTRSHAVYNFVDNLRRAITRAGLTQSELARQIGVPASRLSTYFNGSSLPNDDMFTKLLDGVDVSPAQRAPFEASLRQARAEHSRQSS